MKRSVEQLLIVMYEDGSDFGVGFRNERRSLDWAEARAALPRLPEAFVPLFDYLENEGARPPHIGWAVYQAGADILLASFWSWEDAHKHAKMHAADIHVQINLPAVWKQEPRT